jgi:hypothetical protein
VLQKGLIYYSINQPILKRAWTVLLKARVTALVTCPDNRAGDPPV